METKYKEWIEKNVEGDGYAQCAEVTLKMQEAFPHLIRKRGFYICPFWGERTHWWLQEEDGTIVDPTARQFTLSNGTGEYKVLERDEDCPTGVCMDCGAHVYRHQTFCSVRCERTYTNYINSGRL